MCLAQGHKAVTPVRLEHAAPLSRVKNSTTEPLRTRGGGGGGGGEDVQQPKNPGPKPIKYIFYQIRK